MEESKTADSMQPLYFGIGAVGAVAAVTVALPLVGFTAGLFLYHIRLSIYQCKGKIFNI